MDFLKNQLEIWKKRQSTLLAYYMYLQSDIMQFVWMSMLMQGLLIQWSRQGQFTGMFDHCDQT